MLRLLFTITVAAFALHAGSVSATEPDKDRSGRIDFDQLQPTEGAGSSPQPLLFENVSGTGVDVKIDGPALTVTDLYEFAGQDDVRGNALITNRWPQQDGIAVIFSRPVRTVGIVAGDFGGDEDGPLILRALDCKGREVARDEATWSSGQMPPFAPLMVSALSICQVLFTSGGEHAGSAFSNGTNAADRAADCSKCDPDDFCVIPCDLTESVDCIVDFEEDDVCNPACGSQDCSVNGSRIECICD